MNFCFPATTVEYYINHVDEKVWILITDFNIVTCMMDQHWFKTE